MRICKIEGCAKPRKAHDLCDTHYHRLRRHGDADICLKPKARFGAPIQYLQDAIGFDRDECLEWPFARSSDGYARIWINGKNRSAHRYVCKIAHGHPPTDEHEAAHSCGRGHLGCVNRKHLSWKTHAENMAEMAFHRRAAA